MLRLSYRRCNVILHIVPEGELIRTSTVYVCNREFQLKVFCTCFFQGTIWNNGCEVTNCLVFFLFWISYKLDTHHGHQILRLFCEFHTSWTHCRLIIDYNHLYQTSCVLTIIFNSCCSYCIWSCYLFTNGADTMDWYITVIR
ncbi:Uncharacterised protein [Streptococcus suis]|nr:Uncharacterised protein [Streptococcus suis]